eukprot:1566883-Alexandrium_andersonii.AAC.1
MVRGPSPPRLPPILASAPAVAVPASPRQRLVLVGPRPRTMTMGPSRSLRWARRSAAPAAGTASGWGTSGAGPGCEGGS